MNNEYVPTYMLNAAWWIGRIKKINITSEASFCMDRTGQGDNRVPALRSVTSGERGAHRSFYSPVTVCFLHVCIMQRDTSICALYSSYVLLESYISDKIMLPVNCYGLEAG